MVSFLKPAHYSRQTLTVFWGVQLCNIVLILSHYLLSTSTFPLTVLVKLWLLTASLPIVFLKFSKTSLSIATTTILLLLYLTFIPIIHNLKFAYYVVLLIIIASEKNLLSTLNQIKPKKTHFYLLSIVIVINLGTNWVANFNYLDLLYRGWIHHDTVYFSSLSAMYKNYGVISYGIDGLLPTTYHSFLHKVYAGLSLISGIRIIDIFCLFHPIIVPTSIFLVVFTFFKSINNKFNSINFYNYLILFFIIYFFFPFRSVTITYDFFWSESMFLGTILELLSLIILFDLSKNNKIQYLMVFVLLTYLINLTKSNIAIIHLLHLIGITLINYRNKLLWIGVLIMIPIYYFTLISVSKVGMTQNPINFDFAYNILNYETLTPQLKINSHWFKISYYSFVFYFPIAVYYYLYLRKHSLKIDDFLFILISISTIISIGFNYFFSIGFNSFYFTGSAIFFSAIGITLLNDITINFQKPQILIAIVAYVFLDLFRMGNVDNCSNYLYNRLSQDRPNKLNKSLINELKNIKTNNKNVLTYSDSLLSKFNLNSKHSPFIISALSETVTIGHKPNWDFYLSTEYQRKYPVFLPKNYKIINLNDSTASEE